MKLPPKPPLKIVIESFEDIGRFVNRPAPPAHARPPFEPGNRLEEALQLATTDPRRGKVALYQALLMEPIYLVQVPKPGSTLADLRAKHAPGNVAGRQDGTVPLFTSPERPYDGLPVWPTREWGLPIVTGPGHLVLHDMRGAGFVINPFSRHSRALPAREVVDLVAGRLAPLATEPPRSAARMYPLRPLVVLPPGFADEMRAHARVQPDLVRVYVAEWDVPVGHPEAGVAVVLVSMDPAELHYQGFLAAVSRHLSRQFEYGETPRKMSFLPLHALEEQVHDDDLFLLRQVRTLFPLYTAGGPPLFTGRPVTD